MCISLNDQDESLQSDETDLILASSFCEQNLPVRPVQCLTSLIVRS